MFRCSVGSFFFRLHTECLTARCVRVCVCVHVSVSRCMKKEVKSESIHHYECVCTVYQCVSAVCDLSQHSVDGVIHFCMYVCESCVNV